MLLQEHLGDDNHANPRGHLGGPQDDQGRAPEDVAQQLVEHRRAHGVEQSDRLAERVEGQEHLRIALQQAHPLEAPEVAAGQHRRFLLLAIDQRAQLDAGQRRGLHGRFKDLDDQHFVDHPLAPVAQPLCEQEHRVGGAQEKSQRTADAHGQCAQVGVLFEHVNRKEHEHEADHKHRSDIYEGDIVMAGGVKIVCDGGGRHELEEEGTSAENHRES
mmetsp:Transcript_123045/g.353515  ORF Transcript_123045/g.353515 Transcript_123045/m.353515 type:complete len:216 (-) Transcript_123045:1305-1952(-)